MGQFYAIINYDDITIENIDNHIVKCIDIKHAMEYPNASIIVEKKELKAEFAKNLPRMYTESDNTNFVYPHVVTYDIMDINGKPYNLLYGNAICMDFQILTRRSAYSSDPGRTDAKIKDRFGNYLYLKLKAGYDRHIQVIKNLIIELINFEKKCFSICEVYDMTEELAYANKGLDGIESFLLGNDDWINYDNRHSILRKTIRKIEELKKEIKNDSERIQVLEEQLKVQEKKTKISIIRSKRANYALKKLRII